MIRLLLIHQPTEDFENRRLVSAVSQLPASRGAVTPFALHGAAAWPHVMARLTRLDRELGFNVIHAIGPASLVAALPVGCQPIVYSPAAHDVTRGLNRLRWVSKVRNVTVVAPSASAASALVRSGVLADSIRMLLTPAGLGAQAAISRADLGLTAADRVLLAAGECTRSAGHRLAAWASVILFCLDARYKLLVPGGPYVPIIRQFADNLRQPGFCVFADDAISGQPSVEQLIPIANTGLFTPAGPVGSLAPRLCIAGGLPVVAAPSQVARELPSGRVVYSPEAKAKSLAQTIYRLFESDEARPLRDSVPHSPPADATDDWLSLYEDVQVGRRRYFDNVAIARQS